MTIRKVESLMRGLNTVSKSHCVQWRKWGAKQPTHHFVFQVAKCSELPQQLGVVLFGLHFGVRVDVFQTTREASLSVYLLCWALIFSWFKREA